MLIKRLVYNIITFPVSLILGPVFFFHSRGRGRLLERYGSWNLSGKKVVWFHGASVGEVNGLLPIIKKTKTLWPETEILLTATSTTGLKRGEALVDYTRLLPFDSFPWVRRALSGVKIEVFIFGETEIWYELFEQLNRSNIPQIMVNARLSDHSISRYRLIRWLAAEAIKNVSRICAADSLTKERLIELGGLKDKIEVLGNAKYDTKPSVQDSAQREQIRSSLFSKNLPIIVLGSIRPGEEDIWFEPIKKKLEAGNQFQVIVAPRHPEKFNYFVEKLNQYGFEFERWTEITENAGPTKSKFILLDTLGKLESIYSIASLAFIGGSYIDFGGHNPLEVLLPTDLALQWGRLFQM